MVAQGLVLLSDLDQDAPPLPAVATVSKDDEWESGGFAIGAAAAERGARWIDRPYFTGNPTVAWGAEHALDAAAAGGLVQIGNEPNLELEDWQGGPGGYAAYYRDVRAATGGLPLLYAPPSPGVAGWEEWVATRDAPAYGVHAYGSFDQMRQVVQWYLENVTGELDVTEVNPGAGQSFDLDAWARTDLVALLDWCAGQDRVRSVCYFAWTWNESAGLPSSIDAKGTAVPVVLADWTPPMNGGAVSAIDAVRDGVWALGEQAETLGYPWYGQALKAATALSKGDD